GEFRISKNEHPAAYASAGLSYDTKFLPQYEADEGGLTKAQLNQVRKSAPKAKGGTVRSSLFASENA
ncbi:MAG: hypothetical protein EBX65_07095, partial [Betaproteobacteria bacterium]|nr:hypothetical protein [Betaproteobacteria bacterium]